MYGTAYEAYLGSKADGPVIVSYDAPPSVPVFWSSPRDSAGHVAVSIGGGKCVSDAGVPGRPIAVFDIAQLTTSWKLTYLGWAEYYHGVRVYEPVSPPIPPTTTEVDGSEMFQLINEVSGDPKYGTGYLIIPNGTGKPRAAVIGAQDACTGVPQVVVKWATALANLRAVIDGIGA